MNDSKLKWSRYNFDWRIDAENSLVYNSINNAVVLLETAMVEQFKQGLEINEAAELYESGFIAADDEVEKAKYLLVKRGFHNKSMSFWIYTTMDCNFRCYYCYQKDKHDKDIYMNEETMDLVWAKCKSLVDERKPEEIEVIFMGGEPLLNWNVIEKMTQRFSIYNNVKFSVITNGSLLTSKNIEKLIQHNVKHIQVTLDGPPEIHDKRRFFEGGQKSFDIIFKNLTYLLDNYESVIDVNLRINIDDDNVDSLDSLLELLKQANLHNRLMVVLGDTICSDTGHRKELYQKIIEFYEHAVKMGFTAMITELSPCWMNSELIFLFAPDGNIYKCTSLVGQKEYSVGNVKENKYYSNYYKTLNMVTWKECLDCEFLGICSGGCRYRRLLDTGLWDEVKYCRKEYIKQIVKAMYTQRFSQMESSS